MEQVVKRSLVRFPEWAQTPIPGMSLSAAGLLALADLSTIAQRTAIAGGSSWLDSLLLAPGLHYQQAADELARGTGEHGVQAVETDPDGRVVTHAINNAATAAYIRRIAKPGELITLDVGMLPQTAKRGFRRQTLGQHATVWTQDEAPDLGWLSHLLYLISPVLTVFALVLMVLLRDWWGLGLLAALMLSRILNIWVIKQRAKPTLPKAPKQKKPGKSKASPPSQQQPPPPPPPPPHRQHQSPRPHRPHHHHSLFHRHVTPNSSNQSPPTRDSSSDSSSDSSHHLTPYLTTLLVDLPDGRNVALRGMSDDLSAITADAWLKTKTHAQGYLEAAAKLIVYLVAALSGNQTQAGALISLILLLVTAGLLALSNANAKGLRMRGRVAAPYTAAASGAGGEGGGSLEGRKGEKGNPPYPLAGEDKRDSSWPGSSNVSGVAGLDDWAEKGQVGGSMRDSYPFDHEVDYT